MQFRKRFCSFPFTGTNPGLGQKMGTSDCLNSKVCKPRTIDNQTMEGLVRTEKTLELVFLPLISCFSKGQ